MIATSTFTRSTRAFDEDGDTVSTPRYDKLEVNALFEYGVTDWLTAMIQPQLLWTDIAPPTDAHTFGPDYTDLGARVRLWWDPDEVFSVQVLGRIPGRHNDSNPAEVGNTTPELDLRALYGHTFVWDGRSAFVNAELAYRIRFDDPPNEVRFDLTLGVRQSPDLLLLAQSFNTFDDGSATGVFSDGRKHKVQLSAVWRLDEVWSFQLGGLATVAGVNTLQERGVVAAIWRQF
jgi:hypothetical protein